MLAADIELYRRSLYEKDMASVVDIAVENYVQRSDLEALVREHEKINKEMLLDYDDMKGRLLSAEREIEELRRQNMHLTGVRTMQSQEMYGKSSEKIDNIISDATSSREYSDPLSEDMDAEDESGTDDTNGQVSGKGNVISFESLTGRPGKGGKRGRRPLDLSRLPRCVDYEYYIDKYDQQYGKNGWRIFAWEKHETIETIRQTTYIKETYTPVVSYGLEHMLERSPYEGRIIPKSKVSSSLLAQILCDYGNMHVPFYRLEHDPDRYGFHLSRQTMTSWMIFAAFELLLPVYEHDKSCLRSCKYQQCDETIYDVIMEKTHETNYVWTHRTSELADCEPVIIYCFEPSRSADHLLNFYAGQKEKIYLTCDAYSAYHTLELALPECIELCGCYMHSRRRFVDAIRSVQGFDESIVINLPEMKAISITAELYAIEDQCKGDTASERFNKRQELAKPVVDRYFDLMYSLDDEDPSYSDKLKEAIRYSKNQETYLRRYLEDGHIPIDDGATERNIKPVACHRKNSLFSYSVKGAQATMIIMSLIETAKANNAIPYYYLKYLLEKMSKVVLYGHTNDIDDMMPWSAAYKTYEADQQQHILSSGAPPGRPKPQTSKCDHKIAS